MDWEKQEKIIELFDKFDEWSNTEEAKFENLENPPHETQAISAILFLYDKLKEENKPQNYFLHGEHDELYIGSSFDLFEDFSEEDVKMALSLGIGIGENDGFVIYASM